MTWDLIVVTARSAQQRWLFERYLAGHWPSGEPAWLVQQDPPGPLLGTAAASLLAMGAAARQLGERLAAARVLILHCGGLSQRVPQLAHVGKAFAPGADAERDTTLFAQVVMALDQLFSRSEPGIVVACGDVLYSAADAQFQCRRGEAVALAYPAAAEQASHHGVYLWTAGTDQVAEAWQKPAAERLRGLAADRLWAMDTGILYLGAAVVARLLEGMERPACQPAAPSFRREWRGLELYRDLTPAMTGAWREDARLPGTPGEIQQLLSRSPLRVVRPERAELYHFGTNEELLRILGGGGQPRVHASYITEGEFGAGAVLDRCLAEQPVRVGAGSYVSGLNRPGRELCIGSRRVAYQLPLRALGLGSGLDVCVALGVADDVRRMPAEGMTLLGEPLEAWLRELGACTEEVWDGVPEAERSLWNARLFPVGEAGVVARAVPWLDGDGAAFGERVDQWRRSRRVSMAEAGRWFDARRWWAHEQRIRAHRLAAAVEAAVRRGDGAALGRLMEEPALPARARRLVRQQLERLGRVEAASLTGARAWLVAARLSAPSASAALRGRGFRSLSRALLTGRDTREAELRWRLAPGAAVEAQAPVRVDLVGGWTDTPPQACEQGGTVLNLSLLLEGRPPLSARVERLARPVVELVALDQEVRRTLRVNLAEGQRLAPRDPLALHLAALRLVGLLGREPLAERLRGLGGGLRVTTAADVPKGSGLGSSSILGAALLAALYAALGREVSPAELCPKVLQLEQLMGTGGGWQDQVGGMWGGVKYAVTGPGIEQQPRVETIALDAVRERELQERLVLFYTGEPRLAKDVLQRVVGSYLMGSPATLGALAEMPALTRAARQALLEGDWVALGRCLDRSWALNRQLEPTSTNDSLDALFARIAPHVLGAKLAGAGGGGFLFALARDGAARERLEQLLAEVPPPARLYRATLDREGLVVVRG